MRGGIDSYDPNSGSGVIFGDDGNRYAFSRDTLRDFTDISVGIPVLFDHDGTKVTEAMVRPGWSPSKPRVRYEALTEERGLGPIGYFAKCLILYFDGTGRAQRVEFWSFHAVNFGIFVALQLSFLFIDESSPILIAITGLFLLTLMPTISLAARRIHDAGFDTAFLLIVLFPFIGWIILFTVLWFAPSQRHSNKFGSHPRATRTVPAKSGTQPA